MARSNPQAVQSSYFRTRRRTTVASRVVSHDLQHPIYATRDRRSLVRLALMSVCALGRVLADRAAMAEARLKYTEFES